MRFAIVATVIMACRTKRRRAVSCTVRRAANIPVRLLRHKIMADSEPSPGAPPLKVDALEAELEGKAPPPVPPQTQLEAAGSARPGFWSRITFAFAYPTFRKVLSLRTKVSLADMPVCPPSDAAALQSARMKALIRSKGGVLAAYLHFIKPLFMRGIGLSFCALACMFAGVYSTTISQS